MDLNNVTSEKWQFIIDHPEKMPQGIHLWYKGVPYPRRVYWSVLNDPNHTIRVLSVLGEVKKYLFGLLHLKDVVVPRTFSIKKWEKFLIVICGQINWKLWGFYIKDEEYSVPVWEIGKLVRNFLKNLGLCEEVYNTLTNFLMMVLEFDNAYRYRIQDLLSDINQINKVTLDYILEIYLQRETQHKEHPEWGARGKITRAVKLLKLLLWIPKVKNALIKAHEGVDFDKIKFDDNDRYHFSFWRGYDYEGKNFDERYQFFLNAHKGDFPPFVKRPDPNETIKFMTE